MACASREVLEDEGAPAAARHTHGTQHQPEQFQHAGTMPDGPGRCPCSFLASHSMVRKQQMRWTPRGAHLLLQVRTRVLNDDLPADFRHWYRGFQQEADASAAAA
jgi:hypothetical protein